MFLDLSKEYVLKDGIYDFMLSLEKLKNGNTELEIERDYHWDYHLDSSITPTIIHEWKYLDQLISQHVLQSANSVLSIGGGGTSRTAEYISSNTKLFAIVNTGEWDLKNAQIPDSKITSYLIRAIGEDLPILNSQFDAIEIPATLDHVINAKQVIEESFRVLNSSGMIGITLGNSNSWYRKVIQFLRIPIVSDHDHHHNFHFTVKDVELLLSNAGFIEIETIGSAYLKLPKFFERQFKTTFLLSLHRFLSNVVMRRVLGNSNGGMFLTIGTKPTAT
jgi:ubiquinone/menaquinone biosynthesis C-methylase UbiE